VAEPLDLEQLEAQHRGFATSPHTSAGQRKDSETILALIAEVEMLRQSRDHWRMVSMERDFGENAAIAREALKEPQP
jgi:sulfur relay (sulfurtransferase) DsrC/TusE family protein